MKMKKMLAILAALSVLGTTGLTVGAEDTATTTEPATEAIKIGRASCRERV